MKKMKKKPSTRQKNVDVSCWVEHNNQVQPQPDLTAQVEHHVRFEEPPESCVPRNEEEKVEQPIALDGGYGWFVVLVSMICHAVCDGSSFCYGIVSFKMQEKYPSGRVVSTFSASLFLSLPLILSPFAGMISDVYGCRFSIYVGGLICTVSCILGLFATGIWYLTFTFALGSGIGLSLVYNAIIVIVTYYFKDNKGTALAVAVSGTGFGTSIYPYHMAFFEAYLVDYVDSLNSIIMAFAFGFFVVLILGLIVRDVQWTSDAFSYKQGMFNKLVQKIKAEEDEENVAPKEWAVRRSCSLPNLNIGMIEAGSITSLYEVGGNKKIERGPIRSKSVAFFEKQRQKLQVIPEYTMLGPRLANLEHLDLEMANSPCTTVRATRRRVISKTSMSCDQINELDDDFKPDVHFSSSSSSSSSQSSSALSQDGDSSSSELSEKQTEPLEFETTAANVDPVRSASSAPTSARARNSLAPGNSNRAGGRIMAGNALQNRQTPQNRNSSNLTAMGRIPSAPSLVVRQQRKKGLWNASRKAIMENLEIARELLVENKPYRYLIASVICLYLILDVPYICFFEYATEHLKMPQVQANAVYSTIGTCNLASTLIYGKTSDFLANIRHTVIMYIIAMFGVAISMIIVIVTNDVTGLFISAGLFGISVTANYVLQTVLADGIITVGTQFQLAYSILSMVEGVASIIGTPLIAVLRELTGSFDVVFVLAAVFATLSALFLILVLYYMHERDNQKQSNGHIASSPRRQSTNNTSPETENLLLV